MNSVLPRAWAGALAVAVAACSPAPDDSPSDTAPSDTAAAPPGDVAPEVVPDLPEVALAVRVNELVAANDSLVEDEAGEEDDWIELLNPTGEAVTLTGWALVEDDGKGGRYPFPAGSTLGAGERLVVWLDGQPEQGPSHAPFRLSAAGGSVSVVAPGGAVSDVVSWTELREDLALARIPDGDGPFAVTIHATPGAVNPATPDAAAEAGDPTVALFPDGEVLELALTLPEASVTALEADPYSYVEGAITFAGVTLSPVGIHIKGSTGSLRTFDEKCAFKVKTTAFGLGARLRGEEKLTLNSMVQDGSLVHEQLAYRLFRDAGVAAPRTAYVHLTVNGEDRGLYLHVESADETFLGRWFTNPEGNLYEGGPHIDLDSGSYALLSLDERGSADPDDYSDVAAVAALLDQEPDEALVDELEALVDLDAALQMWAVEVLTGHWDGYFWYPHNYRVYHDPDRDQLVFLPWGTDLTFEQVWGAFRARGEVAHWALSIPSVYDRYLQVLDATAERMQGLPLAEEAEALRAVARPIYATETRGEFTLDDSDASYAATLDFLDAWPGAVRQGITTGVDPGLDRTP